jgi:hypothetical protein
MAGGANTARIPASQAIECQTYTLAQMVEADQVLHCFND